MANRAHLGWRLAAVEQRIGRQGIILPSVLALCLNAAGAHTHSHRVNGRCGCQVALFDWWVDSFYVCVFSVLLSLLFLLLPRWQRRAGVLHRFKHAQTGPTRTGGLSVCLSLPAELMFDQGQTERE